MPTTRITSKGQITIPKIVREQLGIDAGDEIEFLADNGGFRVRKRIVASPFAPYRGYLKHLAGKEPDLLVKEMRGS
jgi:AbrB family looped-hinge helix DNA binding protein